MEENWTPVPPQTGHSDLARGILSGNRMGVIIDSVPGIGSKMKKGATHRRM